GPARPGQIFDRAATLIVIPGREAKRREPGIHWAAIIAVGWIPGSRSARPGMTRGETCAKRRIPE
ncbi:MAG: hypothetical protein ACREC2_02930, partial [Bradyrhizobium sp.]